MEDLEVVTVSASEKLAAFWADHYGIEPTEDPTPIVAVATIPNGVTLITPEIIKAQRERGVLVASGIEATRLKLAFTVRKIGINEYALPGIVIKIIPANYRDDKTIAVIAIKVQSISPKIERIGSLKIGKNRSVYFSADPKLADRFSVCAYSRLMLCLKIMGLIGGDSIKGVNCSLRQHWIDCPQLQNLIGVRLDRGSDPSVPYRVKTDQRAKQPDRYTVKVKRDQPSRSIYSRYYRDDKQTLRAMY
jgi:hypothetical protein